MRVLPRVSVERWLLTLNVPMLLRGFRRWRAGRYVELRSMAVRERVIHPAEDSLVPPAIFLEGSVERITSLSPWRTWELERPLIAGGRRQLGASVAHLFERVEIVGPCIYAGPAVWQPGFGEERLVIRDVVDRVELGDANLVTTWTGSRFFGPYLLDDFPLELVSEDPSENIALPVKPFSHEEGYRRLVGLPPPPTIRRGYVRNLTVFTEPSNNAHKAARYRRLREHLRAHLGMAAASSRPRIYLKRGPTGELRVLKNEASIEQFLVDIGFDVIEPARLGADEIARRTLDASIVVSVEGSHLSHGIFTLADDATLLVLQPPDRFALQYKDFTDCVGMRFAFLVGEPAAESFTVPVDDLRRLLDRLL